MSDDRELLLIAEQAVEATAPMLAIRSGPSYSMKGDRDPVTESDLRIEAAVRLFLSKETPEIPFLGEEGGGDSGSGTFWALDPIDGTANLLRGIPMFAISLALVRDGTARVAVVDAPALGERFTARAGRGTKLNGNRVWAASTDRIEKAVVGLGDFAVGETPLAKSMLQLAATGLFAKFAFRVRLLGSAALQLAWLAAGRLDVGLTFSNKAWDVQAGALLAREAGAEVYDGDGTDHCLASGFTLASTPGLKVRVLELVSAAMRAAQRLDGERIGAPRSRDLEDEPRLEIALASSQ